VAKSNITLAPRQVRNFSLRDWLAGNLPDRRLTAAEINHFKAALTGQRSPKDKMFYSSQVAPGLAVGYVRIKTLGPPQPAALWGDYYLLDGGQASAEGDTLINLDANAGCAGGCKRHAMRFVTSGTFDAGTQVVILSETSAKPCATSQAPGFVEADTLAFDEAGQSLGGNHLRLLPVQVISIADLGLRQSSGWIDLQTEETSIVAIHYTSKKLFGVALMSYCLPSPPPDPGGINLKKLTNGQDANAVPGPSIKVGDPVTWQYILENTGDVRLTDVEVGDDDSRISVGCPKTELAPGERMTCTGHGTADACQYENLGTATARTADGKSVSADDLSHYFGAENAGIELKLLVNGQAADAPTGPTVDAGSRIDWTYKVTNTGEVALNNVKVSDDHGDAVSCPQASLRPGESMTCTASGTAATGQSGKLAKATGQASCTEVHAEDPAYYFGRDHGDPGISLKKLTNGDAAGAAPGKSLPLGSAVRWDYVVRNTGAVRLDNVQVSDDKEGAVACPKSSLQPNESMTCSKTGVVKACQYSNVGTVTATSSGGGKATSNSDVSFYFGQTSPALQVKSFVNGQAADVDSIPTFESGTALQWTFTVTNTGNVALRNVLFTNDHVANVSCPKSSLQAGESMTCSAGGGTAATGSFNGMGTATGTADTVCGGNAGASGPSHYIGLPKLPPPPPPCNGVPSLTELWPPNHKMVDIQVLGIVDATIKITGITQDEPVNEKGDGNTGPDGAGVGTSTAQVRSERSGLGDGRVYVIHYSASNAGGTCNGTVAVGVPHDQRGTPPVDSGQIYDSTVSQ